MAAEDHIHDPHGDMFLDDVRPHPIAGSYRWAELIAEDFAEPDGSFPNRVHPGSENQIHRAQARPFYRHPAYGDGWEAVCSCRSIGSLMHFPARSGRSMIRSRDAALAFVTQHVHEAERPTPALPIPAAPTTEKRSTTVDNEDIKALRKKVTKGVDRDRFDDGTAIRWVSGGRYTYAALKAGGRWWITGGSATFYGKSVFTFTELVNILRRDDVSDVAVATSWETIVA